MTLRQQATRKATTLLKRYCQALPVDVLTIAARLGIDVYVYPLPPDKSGVLTLVDGRWAVGLQSRESRVRQRFSLAHEIGHFLFDAPGVGYYLSRCSPTGAAGERRANLFAAHLLMPASAIRPGMTSTQVARLCQVSRQAAAIRLRELNIPPRP